ncbi:MAG: DNA-3-methyladenine glycosylase I [Clostridia bacterium]|nr:DNA-3-methyladenine glycosylase I [Clostridia bacterium]
MEQNKRCAWVNLKNERYVKYHDEEWGKPLHEDGRLYELLILESFQAGLSWECILNKREAFRAAFDGFDPHKVVAYGEEKVEELMANPGIVRNRRKILATIRNTAVFLEIQKEYGSFDRYIWSFTEGRVIREPYAERTTSPLSDAISADLKRRGMTFVGSTILYSFLQSMGIIFAHGEECSSR